MLPVATLFPEDSAGKSHISLAVYSCGGSCGFGDHLRLPHRIPFSSRLRANRCTTRCCVPRWEFVNRSCTRTIVKKFLQWMGFVVGGLVGLALLGFAYLYFASERELDRQYTLADKAVLVIPTEAVEIAEGKRIAQLAGCMHCHGDDLSGTVVDDIPKLVRLVAPNISTLLPDYSDAQLATVLRK